LIVPDTSEKPTGPLPELRPPVADEGVSPARWRGYLAIVLLAGLTTLAGVLAWLPERPTTGAGAPSPATVRDVERAGMPPATAARHAAEEQLQELLRLRAEPGLARVEEWATDEWPDIASQVQQGDTLMGRGDFVAAEAQYRAAHTSLQRLLGERDSRIAAALEAGDQALAQNLSDTAIGHYSRALAINPEETAAARGLARAQARDEVLALLAEAERAEQRQEWATARDHYAAALLRDPDYAPLATGAARVAGQLAAAAHGEAMSEVLAALEAGHLDSAAAALERAAQTGVDATVVEDARQRLAAARLRAALDELRRSASGAAKAENWSDAIASYRRALALQPGSVFASAGLAHATARQAVNEQVDHYLAAPQRLYSPQPLANARQLLNGLDTPPDSEPRLAAKLSRLERLLTLAEMPMPVLLLSDGETDVVIHHVGSLGRFRQHQLELTPGRYTIVGSRTGYRDVRHVIDVIPGGRLPPLEVRCEEPV